jgi:hypothetical protein
LRTDTLHPCHWSVALSQPINGPASTIVRNSIALARGEVRRTAEHPAIRCGQCGEVYITLKLPHQRTPDYFGKMLLFQSGRFPEFFVQGIWNFCRDGFHLIPIVLRWKPGCQRWRIFERIRLRASRLRRDGQDDLPTERQLRRDKQDSQEEF